MVDVSWIIQNNWIADYKWLYGEQEGRDMGVPATVDRMFKRRDELNSLVAILDGKDTLEDRKRSGLALEDDGSLDPQFYIDVMNYPMPEDRGLLGIDSGVERTELIYAYFLMEGIQDNDGSNHVEGELRRYVSQRDGIKPGQVTLTPEHVASYVNDNQLPEEFEEIISCKI